MLQQTVQRETVETSAKIAQSTMKPTDNALAVALSLSLLSLWSSFDSIHIVSMNSQPC